MNTDIETLQRAASGASERLLRGEAGPIFLGQWSLDAFHRAQDSLASSIKLAWTPTEDESRDTIGLVHYYGDPSSPHQSLIQAISEQVNDTLRAFGLEHDFIGGTTMALKVRRPTARDPDRVHSWSKDPDGLWGGVACATNRTFKAVLEVAWKNESFRQMVIDADNWARAGLNSLAVKAFGGTDGSDPSIALVAQHAGIDAGTSVWLFGSAAEAEIARGNYAHLQRQPGFQAVLPAGWFRIPPRRVPRADFERMKVTLDLRTLAVHAKLAALCEDIGGTPTADMVRAINQGLIDAMHRESDAIQASTSLHGATKAVQLSVVAQRIQAIAELCEEVDDSDESDSSLSDPPSPQLQGASDVVR
ncbi:unnamed protein product [Parajaminaea phylloscopi]